MTELFLAPVAGDEPTKRRRKTGICKGKRFIEQPGREQVSLVVRCVDDMVPEGAQVRVLDELMDELDYSALEAKHQGGGRPAYPPSLLCRLWVYAFMRGVRSARELSRRLETDLAFMWLAREQRIDHETLSDFRRRCGRELKSIFVATVDLGRRAGLVKLEHVAIDGTKIAACSARRMKTGEDLEEALARLERRIEELLAAADEADGAEDAAFGSSRGDEVPEELRCKERRRERLREAKARLEQEKLERISVTDFEAPLQKTQDGKRAGYNCQAAVDATAGFVVAESTTVSQDDHHEFIGMAEAVIETVGAVPAEFSADSGYHSAETLEALEARPEWNAYVFPQPVPEEQKDRLSYNDMEYDEETDRFRCPGSGVLEFWHEVVLRGTLYRAYRSRAAMCKGCAHRGRCLSKSLSHRRILVPPHAELLAKMRARASSKAGKAARLLRKCTVERVFGVMKAQMGLRQFLLRGLEGAATEFRLAAITTNIGKLVRHRMASAAEPG